MKPVSLVQVFLVLFLAGCFGGEGPEMSTADAQMVSGQPILVGGNGGVGPLPSIGISSTPLGFAHVYGEKRPDIFVSSDRWYPGGTGLLKRLRNKCLGFKSVSGLSVTCDFHTSRYDRATFN